MKNLEKDKNNIKGITLISLIVTIIVLLILAGIALNLIVGQNGILERSKDATKLSKISEIAEKLEIEKSSVAIDNGGTPSLEEYLEHIVKEGIIEEKDIVDTGEENSRLITVEDKYVFLVEVEEDENIKITYAGEAGKLEPEIEIVVENITTNEIKIKVNGARMEKGEYEYYIKDVEKGEEYKLKDTSQKSEYTFSRLTQNKEYQIKVIAKNIGRVEKETGIIITTSLEDLVEGNIEFIYNPEGWSNSNITVTATANIEVPSGYSIRTSKDAINWTNDKSLSFTEKGNTYAQLYDGINETTIVVGEVSKFDKELPNDATIVLNATEVGIDASTTAIVTQSDNLSGVDIRKCRWDYTTSSAKIGTNEIDYKGGEFSSTTQTLTLSARAVGSYYLHVLTIDNAGNKKETVSNKAIEVKKIATVGVKVTGENKEYTKNGTAVVPVGFAVVPGLDDISQGLVISDVANDTENKGNQFVWIPVTDATKYVRNTTYGDLKASETAVDMGTYLPTYFTAEKTTVVASKGFYVARYETGTGRVSKKGGNVWTGLTISDARTQANNFINNENVGSALISGRQWDYIMALVQRKTDGEGGTFTVGQTHMARKPKAVSGSYEEDRVYNIYDLEGNFKEWTAERNTYYNNTKDNCRGGDGLQSAICNGVGAPYRPAAYRTNYNTAQGNAIIGFRMVLYVKPVE